jgi:hypothetical protein
MSSEIKEGDKVKIIKRTIFFSTLLAKGVVTYVNWFEAKVRITDAKKSFYKVGQNIETDLTQLEK